MTTEEKEERTHRQIEIQTQNDGVGMTFMLFTHVGASAFVYFRFIHHSLFYSQHPYLFWFLALIGAPIVIATILGIIISIFAPPPSKSRKINEKRSCDNAMFTAACSFFYMSSIIIIPLALIMFLFMGIFFIPHAIENFYQSKNNKEKELENKFNRLKLEMKEMGVEV